MPNKYRVHEVAWDFKVRAQTVLDILERYGVAAQNHMTALDSKQLDLVFSALMQPLFPEQPPEDIQVSTTIPQGTPKSNLLDRETAQRIRAEREEAERKAREAEAAAKKAKEEAEAAERRKREAEAAEARRAKEAEERRKRDEERAKRLQQEAAEAARRRQAAAAQRPAEPKPFTLRTNPPPTSARRPAPARSAPKPTSGPVPAKPGRLTIDLPEYGEVGILDKRAILVLCVLLSVYGLFLFSLQRDFWPDMADCVQGPFWFLSTLPERLLYLLNGMIPAHPIQSLLLLAVVGCVAVPLGGLALYKTNSASWRSLRVSVPVLLLSMLTVDVASAALYASALGTGDAPAFLVGGLRAVLIKLPLALGLYLLVFFLLRYALDEATRQAVKKDGGLGGKLDDLLMYPERLACLLGFAALWLTQLSIAFRAATLWTGDPYPIFFLNLAAVLIFLGGYCVLRWMFDWEGYYRMLENPLADGEEGGLCTYGFRTLVLILCFWAVDLCVWAVTLAVPIGNLLSMRFLGIGVLWRWALALFLAERLMPRLLASKHIWNDQDYDFIYGLTWSVLAVIAVLAAAAGPLDMRFPVDGARTLPGMVGYAMDYWFGSRVGPFYLGRELLLPPMLGLAGILVFLAMKLHRALRCKDPEKRIFWTGYLAVPAISLYAMGPLWQVLAPRMAARLPEPVLPWMAAFYTLLVLFGGALLAGLLARERK